MTQDDLPTQPELLHGVARNRAIKDLVQRHSGLALSRIRVRLGKGTASRWATITTDCGPERLRDSIQADITHELIDRRLIGQYPDDMSNDMYPCVHFQAARPRPLKET